MIAIHGVIQLELSDFLIYLLLFDDTQTPRERFLNFLAWLPHWPIMKKEYESLDPLPNQKGFRFKLKS